MAQTSSGERLISRRTLSYVLVGLSTASCATRTTSADAAIPRTEQCSLTVWQAAHPEFAKTLILPVDSLDTPLERVGGSSSTTPPPGFQPGYQALVVLALVIDSLGQVIIADPVRTEITPPRSSLENPEPFGFRRGLEQWAADDARRQRFTSPRRNGVGITAFTCAPWRLRG